MTVDEELDAAITKIIEILQNTDDEILATDRCNRVIDSICWWDS